MGCRSKRRCRCRQREEKLSPIKRPNAAGRVHLVPLSLPAGERGHFHLLSGFGILPQRFIPPNRHRTRRTEPVRFHVARTARRGPHFHLIAGAAFRLGGLFRATVPPDPAPPRATRGGAGTGTGPNGSRGLWSITHRGASIRDPDRRDTLVRAALERARDLGCGFVVFPGQTLVAVPDPDFAPALCPRKGGP